MTLAGIDDYQDRHGPVDAGDVDKITTLLADASSLIERHNAARSLAPQVAAVEVLDGDGSHELFLEHLPVTAVTSVVEDGEVLVDGADFDWYRTGRLVRRYRCWPCRPRIVTVTYDHGNAIDEWLVNLACTVVHRAVRPSAAEGIQSETTGSQTVSYFGSAAGVNLWLTRDEVDRIEGIRGPEFA